MNFLKYLFAIGLPLGLIIICLFAAQRSYSNYLQQVVLAQEIEKLGGEVFYGWHNPTVVEDVYFASSARPEVMKDGTTKMVPFTNPVPFRRVSISPPKEDPSWSIFDCSNNWDIQHVALPDNQFSANTIHQLKTIPRLRYIEVKFTGKHYHPSESEIAQVEAIQKTFPQIEVLNTYVN